MEDMGGGGNLKLLGTIVELLKYCRNNDTKEADTICRTMLSKGLSPESSGERVAVKAQPINETSLWVRPKKPIENQILVNISW